MMPQIKRSPFCAYLGLFAVIAALTTMPVQFSVASPAVVDTAPEQEGKFTGPGLAGLRVNPSLILFLSVQPVVSEYYQGNKLRKIQVILKFFNDSYQSIGEVTDHLSLLPRVVMRDRSGKVLLDKYASIYGEPRPAASVTWDWPMFYKDMSGTGRYEMILTYEGREVRSSFEIR
jgi:hypothetical protein